MPTHYALNDPLRIAEIETPGGGHIGITFAPGKKQLNGWSGNHDRDLAADLDLIRLWKAAAVVTLVEDFELDALKISNLGEEVRRRSMEWHHWPIRDYDIPDPVFETAWPANSASLCALLQGGGRILVHCKGGLGRAGMVAARLLVDMGVPGPDAVMRVRKVRPGAMQTADQEEWAVGQSWLKA
jgi:ADP-ribosyl-[dinitrogen reductase] hydrolase